MKIFLCRFASFVLLVVSNSIGIYGDDSEFSLLVDDLKMPEDPGDNVETPRVLDVAESDGPAEIIIGDAPCSCGTPRLGERIVGGELAKINELPWTVAVVKRDKNKAFCGATLICDRYVVTAAHCMKYVNSPDEILVFLMEEDFEEENENAQPTLKLDVIEIIKHPDYDPRKINNDITLLKLATPVNINDGDEDSMQPACLPANNDVSFAGLVATVAGWGATSYGNPVVSQLRKVDVPIFAQQECIDETQYTKVLTENMLCAGYLEGQKDGCQGDSGGPLVVPQNGKYILVGIVSFGYNCAQPKAPGVYARVGRYPDWIRENTPDCQYCSQ